MLLGFYQRRVKVQAGIPIDAQAVPALKAKWAREKKMKNCFFHIECA
jgi:hypothetical protein